MVNFARHMKDTCTYWAVTGIDDHGKRVFAAPALLNCRWEEKQEMIRNKTGKEVVSKSRVFVASVVGSDGYLYHGTSVATDPRTVSGAFEIQAVGQQPDLRALRQLNVAYL